MQTVEQGGVSPSSPNPQTHTTVITPGVLSKFARKNKEEACNAARNSVVQVLNITRLGADFFMLISDSWTSMHIRVDKTLNDVLSGDQLKIGQLFLLFEIAPDKPCPRVTKLQPLLEYRYEKIGVPEEIFNEEFSTYIEDNAPGPRFTRLAGLSSLSLSVEPDKPPQQPQGVGPVGGGAGPVQQQAGGASVTNNAQNSHTPDTQTKDDKQAGRFFKVDSSRSRWATPNKSRPFTAQDDAGQLRLSFSEMNQHRDADGAATFCSARQRRSNTTLPTPSHAGSATTGPTPHPVEHQPQQPDNIATASVPPTKDASKSIKKEVANDMLTNAPSVTVIRQTVDSSTISTNQTTTVLETGGSSIQQPPTPRDRTPQNSGHPKGYTATSPTTPQHEGGGGGGPCQKGPEEGTPTAASTTPNTTVTTSPLSATALTGLTSVEVCTSGRSSCGSSTTSSRSKATSERSSAFATVKGGSNNSNGGGTGGNTTQRRSMSPSPSTLTPPTVGGLSTPTSPRAIAAASPQRTISCMWTTPTNQQSSTTESSSSVVRSITTGYSHHTTEGSSCTSTASTTSASILTQRHSSNNSTHHVAASPNSARAIRSTGTSPTTFVEDGFAATYHAGSTPTHALLQAATAITLTTPSNTVREKMGSSTSSTSAYGGTRRGKGGSVRPPSHSSSSVASSTSGSNTNTGSRAYSRTRSRSPATPTAALLHSHNHQPPDERHIPGTPSGTPTPAPSSDNNRQHRRNERKTIAGFGNSTSSNGGSGNTTPNHRSEQGRSSSTHSHVRHPQSTHHHQPQTPHSKPLFELYHTDTNRIIWESSSNGPQQQQQHQHQQQQQQQQENHNQPQQEEATSGTLVGGNGNSVSGATSNNDNNSNTLSLSTLLDFAVHTQAANKKKISELERENQRLSTLQSFLKQLQSLQEEGHTKNVFIVMDAFLYYHKCFVMEANKLQCDFAAQKLFAATHSKSTELHKYMTSNPSVTNLLCSRVASRVTLSATPAYLTPKKQSKRVEVSGNFGNSVVTNNLPTNNNFGKNTANNDIKDAYLQLDRQSDVWFADFLRLTVKDGNSLYQHYELIKQHTDPAKVLVVLRRLQFWVASTQYEAEVAQKLLAEIDGMATVWMEKVKPTH